MGEADISIQDHPVVLVARNPSNKDSAILLIASDRAEVLPGLARKLPHYHKYSYLAFEGDEPSNVSKGRWPVLDSPMTAFIPGKNGAVTKIGTGKLAPRPPLAALPTLFSGERMINTVRFLSGSDLGGRGFGTEGLDRAAEHIAQSFREAGLVPAGDGKGSYFQEWEESGGEPEHRAVMKNVIGAIPGKKDSFAGQSIVVGAHYDHLGLGWPDARKGHKGELHPGADDNASGVSVLIELARVLAKGPQPDRTILFVAFTGEEAGRRGSRHYLSHQELFPAGKCMAMLNLDTVGRLGKGKLLAPGADSAREWVHILRGAGFVTGVETEAVSGSLDSSDNMSFEEAGIPAVQLFSGPHPDYHRPSDTADKIDTEGLVKVASVAGEVIEYLSAREEPLTVTAKAAVKTAPGAAKVRKAGIGTIPDFAYRGSGCRISGVTPGSPAEAAGLREGDVIVRINSRAINGLKDLSDVLKALAPGDRISILFLRDGKEQSVETEVTER